MASFPTAIPANWSTSRQHVHGVAVDLRLRLAGLSAICLAAGAGRWLVDLVHVGAHHPATPLEYGCAVVAFLGASCGGAMLVYGHHLLDEVEVSEPLVCARGAGSWARSMPVDGEYQLPAVRPGGWLFSAPTLTSQR